MCFNHDEFYISKVSTYQVSEYENEYEIVLNTLSTAREVHFLVSDLFFEVSVFDVKFYVAIFDLI